MELSCFTLTFMADDRLKMKMNRFEVGLNLGIKERKSVWQCASYVNLYDTMVNVERTMRERYNCFNEQCGIKRKGGSMREPPPPRSVQEASREPLP